MKIGIQTWGSNGDIRPMIAFGGELVKRGHDVTIGILSVDGKDYSSLCESHGINYINIVKVDSRIVRALSEHKHSFSIFNFLFGKLLIPFIDEIYRNGCKLAFENDILIGHVLMFPLKTAAIKYKKRYVSVVFWPGLLSSKYQPPFPLKRGNTILNTLSWKIFDIIFNQFLKKEVNGLNVKELGRKVKSVLKEGCLSDELNILPVSSNLWNVCSDWNGKNIITGSWEIEINKDEKYKYQNEIEKIMGNNKRNVFMSLGSPQQADSKKAMELMISVARRLDANVFMHTTEEKYKDNTIYENIYFFDKIPHGIIMPFCDVAIHHGGAGITQTALKYGVPSIVLGFFIEQMSWGVQIYKMGCGEKPLKYKSATMKEILKRIEKLLVNDYYKINTKKAAEKIRMENGLLNSALLIEKLFEKKQKD